MTTSNVKMKIKKMYQVRSREIKNLLLLYQKKMLLILLCQMWKKQQQVLWKLQVLYEISFEQFVKIMNMCKISKIFVF